jgi:hypothetical protein
LSSLQHRSDKFGKIDVRVEVAKPQSHEVSTQGAWRYDGSSSGSSGGGSGGGGGGGGMARSYEDDIVNGTYVIEVRAYL